MKLLILPVIVSLAMCGAASAQSRLTAGMAPSKPGDGTFTTKAAGAYTAPAAAGSCGTSSPGVISS